MPFTRCSGFKFEVLDNGSGVVTNQLCDMLAKCLCECACVYGMPVWKAVQMCVEHEHGHECLVSENTKISHIVMLMLRRITTIVKSYCRVASPKTFGPFNVWQCSTGFCRLLCLVFIFNELYRYRWSCAWCGYVDNTRTLPIFPFKSDTSVAHKIDKNFITSI